MSDKTKGILAVSVGSIFLGSIGIFVRYAGSSIEPMMQSFGRIFFAFVCIMAYNLIRGKGSLKVFKIKRKDYGLFLLNGLLGFSLQAAAFTLSVLYTNISNTYFLLYAAPVWAAVLSYFFLKEKVKQSTVFAIIGSIIGLFFLFNPTNMQAHLLGNLFGVVVGFTFGSYFVITGKLRKSYSSLTVTMWGYIIGALGVFPLIFIFDNNVQFILPISDWLPVIGASLIILIGYLLLNYGLGKIKASLGSVLSLFEPLSAVVYGLIFFSEVPGVSVFAGAMLILGSILYLTLKQDA